MGALLVFFALTFLVTWTCWGAAAALWGSGRSPALSVIAWPVFYLGVFTPGLVALWLTNRAEGKPGVRALVNRLFQWDVGARWYVFAIGYMAAIKLGVAVIHRLATGAWPRFGDEPWFLMIAATIFSTVIGGQAGEEIGWRGYALPRMAALRLRSGPNPLGLGGASVFLGVIWACWHLPLFFIPATSTTGQSFPVYVLQVTAVSVAIGWLYAHTRGSLLLVMLLHAAVNNTKDIVPSAIAGASEPFALSTSLVAWLTLALLWVCAGYFLIRMPKGPAGSEDPASV